MGNSFFHQPNYKHETVADDDEDSLLPHQLLRTGRYVHVTTNPSTEYASTYLARIIEDTPQGFFFCTSHRATIFLSKSVPVQIVPASFTEVSEIIIEDTTRRAEAMVATYDTTSQEVSADDLPF